METLGFVLLIFVALLGWPIGRFIASKTQEELKSGKKWFKLIICACIAVLIVSFLFASGDSLFVLIASFNFILLLTLASLMKIKKKKR